MKNEANPVYQLLDDFLLDCEVRGLQAISIKSYGEKLRYYFKNYEFAQTDINRFILDKRKSGSSIATINSYLRCLKALNNYTKAGLSIKFIKEEVIVKDIYTDDEIKKIITRPDTKSFNKYKIWALECFLLGTGCRISTALEVKVEDIDFNSGYVVFRHMKNKSQLLFPLSRYLTLVLKQYIAVRGNSGYLFCNSYGDKADMRTIQRAVQRYNKSLGIDKSSCHMFRRTYASTYARNGGSAFYLQKLMGWKNIDMALHYVNLYGTDLKNGLEQLSPLDTNVKKKIHL